MSIHNSGDAITITVQGAFLASTDNDSFARSGVSRIKPRCLNDTRSWRAKHSPPGEVVSARRSRQNTLPRNSRLSLINRTSKMTLGGVGPVHPDHRPLFAALLSDYPGYFYLVAGGTATKFVV